MKLVKCGLCGFKFEHGMKICQGCQGKIEYGANGIEVLFGIGYAFVFWLIFYVYLEFGDISLWWLLIAFFVGAFHTAHRYRDEIKTTKDI